MVYVAKVEYLALRQVHNQYITILKLH